MQLLRQCAPAVAPAAVPAGQRCFAPAHKCASMRLPRKRQAARCCERQAAEAAPRPGHPGSAAAAGSSNSRRQLLLSASLLAASPFLSLQSGAEEEANNAPIAAAASSSSSSSSSSRQVFFDVTVDRKPLGRFVVEVFPDAPAIGGQRFLDLSQGKEGVHYRKTKFELIEDGFIQDSGLKSLSYQASGRTAITGGPDTELLEEELAAQQQRGSTAHDSAGLVSILVKPRIEIVSKDKLVASGGKLITVTETFGEIPNGSAWAVTTKPMPELDETHLVVGRVVQGMDVVEAIAALPRVKDNTGSPFFQAGKAAGDKRADVAQRAFNKPFNKIVVNECGFLS